MTARHRTMPAKPTPAAHARRSGAHRATVHHRAATAARTARPARRIGLRTRVVGVVAVACLGTSALMVAGAHSQPGTAATTQPLVTIYGAGQAPTRSEPGDRNQVELGVRFNVTRFGEIVAIRFYKPAIDTGVHTGTVWSPLHAKLATGTFQDETRSGWQTLVLAKPVAVRPGHDYVASYHAPHGQYAESLGEFAGGHRSGNAVIRATAGVYAYGATAYPSATWNGTGYGVDVSFRPSATPPPTTTPTPPTTTPKPPTTTPPSSTPPTTTPPTSTPPTAGIPVPNLPNVAGFPDAANTGVPAGTKLISVPGAVQSGDGWFWDKRGWVVVNKAGATFAGYRTAGGINVMAPNVTVANNDVFDDGEGSGISLRPAAYDVTVSHNTVHGPCLLCKNRLTYGINGDTGGDRGARVIANKVYWVDHPLQMERGLLQDNLVYALASSGTDHVDAFFSGGGTTDQLTIRHNSLLNDYTRDGSTASIMLNNAFGTQSNRLVENNLIGGGGYALYGGGGVAGKNVIIRNNLFTTKYEAKSGYYGPVAYLLGGPTNVFSNNRWADGPNAGKLITP